jgi:Holliday junction DNA helicase RuvB
MLESEPYKDPARLVRDRFRTAQSIAPAKGKINMFERNSFHLFPEDDESSSFTPEPVQQDDPGTFRPGRLSEIIGQPRITKRLTTHIGYAVAAGKQPGHVLITGPSGYGKTSIASTLSSEMVALGVTSKFHETMADAIDNVRQLALILSRMESGDVWLIDEIHTLRPKVSYALYKALEDRVLSLPGGAEPVRIPDVTIVGATTHPGKVAAALRGRFSEGGTVHVEPYTVSDLTAVLLSHAARANVDINHEASEIIARSSRFTPRLAIQNLAAVRAYAWEMTQDANAKIDAETASQGLEYNEIDPYGLNARDHFILRTMLDQFMGGAIGLNPFATACGMDPSELQRDILPYLIQTGLWRQSGRGQCATKGTYKVLGRTVPPMINGNW